jgi:hypothetical protein
MTTKPKRPRDTNQLAHLIAAIATGEGEDIKTDDGKNAAAVALGRKGGLKGGKARAESLTAKQRSEIAKKAAAKRWSKQPEAGHGSDVGRSRKARLVLPEDA